MDDFFQLSFSEGRTQMPTDIKGRLSIKCQRSMKFQPVLRKSKQSMQIQRLK